MRNAGRDGLEDGFFSGLKNPAEEFDRAQSSSSSVHVYARQNKKKTNLYKTSHS